MVFGFGKPSGGATTDTTAYVPAADVAADVNYATTTTTVDAAGYAMQPPMNPYASSEIPPVTTGYGAEGYAQVQTSHHDYADSTASTYSNPYVAVPPSPYGEPVTMTTAAAVEAYPSAPSYDAALPPSPFGSYADPVTTTSPSYATTTGYEATTSAYAPTVSEVATQEVMPEPISAFAAASAALAHEREDVEEDTYQDTQEVASPFNNYAGPKAEEVFADDVQHSGDVSHFDGAAFVRNSYVEEVVEEKIQEVSSDAYAPVSFSAMPLPIMTESSPEESTDKYSENEMAYVPVMTMSGAVDTTVAEAEVVSTSSSYEQHDHAMTSPFASTSAEGVGVAPEEVTYKENELSADEVEALVSQTLENAHAEVVSPFMTTSYVAQEVHDDAAAQEPVTQTDAYHDVHEETLDVTEVVEPVASAHVEAELADEPMMQTYHAHEEVAEEEYVVEAVDHADSLVSQEMHAEPEEVGQPHLETDVEEASLKEQPVILAHEPVMEQSSVPVAVSQDDAVAAAGFVQALDRLTQLMESRCDALEKKINNSTAAVLPLVASAVASKAIRVGAGDASIIKLGVLEPLLADRKVTDIMINGAHNVFVERGGVMTKTEIEFPDNQAVLELAQQISEFAGRTLDTDNPIVDARLPDGSRVNIIVPPLALDGVVISIRKFGGASITLDTMVQSGVLTQMAAEFLQVAAKAKVNIIVSGGTGTGKTTLLNSISRFIGDHERIVTIEDSAELQLQQPHVVRLEASQAKKGEDGNAAITIRDLVKNALRMRPERILVGESRGPEAFDMIQAMNTGHDGSFTTIHANTPRDAVGRLENMIGMANLGLPLNAIRKQIASAVHLIIQTTRMDDGTRRITHISEVVGMEGDVLTMQDIFTLQLKVDGQGKQTGGLVWANVFPRHKVLNQLLRDANILKVSM